MRGQTLEDVVVAGGAYRVGMAAPGGTGPIGPFPPRVADSDEARDECDRLRRRVLWTVPYGLYVVGSTDHGIKRQLMTLNWATQVSFDPKLFGIGVERSALTHELVGQGGVFSVCFVDRDDRAIVRRFTKPVEVDFGAMTLNGFPFHDGVTGAPILGTAWVESEPGKGAEFHATFRSA